ncbi:TPA: hypothetical protein P0E30_003751 [Vibrio harveyi]|nr:hypothetical protein [Vibrio harveyi]
MNKLHIHQCDRLVAQLSKEQIAFTSCAHSIEGLIGRSLVAIRSRLVELRQEHGDDPIWCHVLTCLFVDLDKLDHKADKEMINDVLRAAVTELMEVRESTLKHVRHFEHERGLNKWTDAVAGTTMDMPVFEQIKLKLIAESSTFLTITHQLWEALSNDGTVPTMTMKTAHEIIEERAQHSELFDRLQKHIVKAAPENKREMAALIANAHQSHLQKPFKTQEYPQ